MGLMTSDARDIEDSPRGARLALHHAVFRHSIYNILLEKGHNSRQVKDPPTSNSHKPRSGLHPSPKPHCQGLAPKRVRWQRLQSLPV